MLNSPDIYRESERRGDPAKAQINWNKKSIRKAKRAKIFLGFSHSVTLGVWVERSRGVGGLRMKKMCEGECSKVIVAKHSNAVFGTTLYHFLDFFKFDNLNC